MKPEDTPQAAHAASELDDYEPPRQPLTMGEAIAVIAVILLSGIAAVSIVAAAVNALVGGTP